MSEKKYQNFEIMIMDVKVLKEELQKEIQKEQPDESYIEEILNYGAWGDSINQFNEETTTIEKAFKLLHSKEKMTLHFLSEKGYTALIKPMLERHDFDPNVKDGGGSTALHYASGWGSSKMVQAILEHPKTDPNIQAADGSTALQLASEYGHLQAVEALLSHPKTDITITNKSGETAWDVANPKIREQFPQLKP